MVRILILPSADGDDWTHAIGIPDGMSDEDAKHKAADAIDSAMDANPEEDTWEGDTLPALIATGFYEVDWVHGPTWDSRS